MKGVCNGLENIFVIPSPSIDEKVRGGASRQSEATSASGIALDEGVPVVIGLKL